MNKVGLVRFFGRLILISALLLISIGSAIAQGTTKTVDPLNLTVDDTIPSRDQVFTGGISNVGRAFSSPADLVATTFRVIISVSGAIFLVLLLIAGVRYLVSAGNEEGTTKAKKMLVDAIIGLVIVLAAWAVGTWILGQLGFRAAGNAIPGSNAPTNTTTPGGTGPGGTAPIPGQLPKPATPPTSGATPTSTRFGLTVTDPKLTTSDKNVHLTVLTVGGFSKLDPTQQPNYSFTIDQLDKSLAVTLQASGYKTCSKPVIFTNKATQLTATLVPTLGAGDCTISLQALSLQ